MGRDEERPASPDRRAGLENADFERRGSDPDAGFTAATGTGSADRLMRYVKCFRTPTPACTKILTAGKFVGVWYTPVKR